MASAVKCSTHIYGNRRHTAMINPTTCPPPSPPDRDGGWRLFPAVNKPIGRYYSNRLQSHHPFAGILEEFNTKSFSAAPDNLSFALVVLTLRIWQGHSDDLADRRDDRRFDIHAAAAVVDQIALVKALRRGKEYIAGKGYTGFFAPLEVSALCRLQHSRLLFCSSLWPACRV